MSREQYDEPSKDQAIKAFYALTQPSIPERLMNVLKKDHLKLQNILSTFITQEIRTIKGGKSLSATCNLVTPASPKRSSHSSPLTFRKTTTKPEKRISVTVTFSDSTTSEKRETSAPISCDFASLIATVIDSAQNLIDNSPKKEDVRHPEKKEPSEQKDTSPPVTPSQEWKELSGAPSGKLCETHYTTRTEICLPNV